VTSDPDFKVTTFFEVNISKTVRVIGQPYYSTLIGHHTEYIE